MMATTKTTSARGTPLSHANAHTYTYTHTQPQSQTTAAVHEFRCLFTHDAHKKKKKWHDGSVRFHTFNRRVMLYDDTNNYVSSLHFRQDDDFDEGVELRLDGGVLVDVGERQGETQTDLAPILDRKKDSNVSPQPARTIRLVAAASQSHPKPLSQILGTQSRLGRARPLPSPYQQRHPLVPAQPTQPAQTSMLPPPKRQKLNTYGKENDNAASTSAVMPTPPLPRLQQSTRPAPQLEEPQKTAPAIMDLSSDDETRPAVTKKQKNKPKSPKPLPPRKVPPSPRQQDRTSMNSPLRNGQSSSRQASAETGRDTRHPSLLRPDQSMQTTIPRPGMTWLRLCRNKPRCKITNSALFPGSDSLQHRRAHHVLRDPSDISCQHSAAEASTDAHYALQPATPHLDLQSLPRRGSSDEPVQIFSSPMFIPEDTQQTSNSPRPQPSRASTPDSHLADMLKDSDTDTILATEAANAHTEREQIQSLAPQQPSQDDMSPPPSSHDPFKIGREHILPPPEPSLATLSIQVSPSRQRPFRRVRSVNDAEDGLEDALCNFEGLSAPPPSFLAASRPSPVRPRTGVSRSPAKLRRTASDSVAMEPDDETVTSYNNQPLQQEDEETGPWTAIEAYLLFDSWPVGKQKPDYGIPVPSELRTGPGELTRASITTAREMLRDEINVL